MSGSLSSPLAWRPWALLALLLSPALFSPQARAESSALPAGIPRSVPIGMPTVVPGQVAVADVLALGATPKPSVGAFLDSGFRLAYPLGQWAESMDPWGWRYSPTKAVWRMHTGVDLAAPKGTPVLAALAGRVLAVNVVSGYGNTVLLDHGNGLQTLYAHLQRATVLAGDWLEPEMVLGAVGMTGSASGPHLHFELRQRGQGLQALDPTPYLPPLMAPPLMAPPVLARGPIAPPVLAAR